MADVKKFQLKMTNEAVLVLNVMISDRSSNWWSCSQDGCGNVSGRLLLRLWFWPWSSWHTEDHEPLRAVERLGNSIRRDKGLACGIWLVRTCWLDCMDLAWTSHHVHLNEAYWSMWPHGTCQTQPPISLWVLIIDSNTILDIQCLDGLIPLVYRNISFLCLL